MQAELRRNSRDSASYDYSYTSSDNDTVSSSDSEPDIYPALTSTSKSLLPELLEALNHCSKINQIFSNHGQNIVEHVPRPTDLSSSNTSIDQLSNIQMTQWVPDVRLELQKVQYFLERKSPIKYFSTDVLEFLLMSKLKESNPHGMLTTSSVLECLMAIPELKAELLCEAFAEGQNFSIIPFPISASCESDTISQCLEEVFWTAPVTSDDNGSSEDGEPDWSDLPFITHLGNVFVISVEERGREVDEIIRPEVFLEENLQKYKQFWQSRIEIVVKMSNIRDAMHNNVYIDGRNIPTCLDIVYKDLETVNPKAANEISEKVKELKDKWQDMKTELDELQGKAQNLKAQFEEFKNTLTPYHLQSLVLVDYTGSEMIALRNEDSTWKLRRKGSEIQGQSFRRIKQMAAGCKCVTLFYEREGNVEQTVEPASSIVEYFSREDVELKKFKSNRFSMSPTPSYDSPNCNTIHLGNSAGTTSAGTTPGTTSGTPSGTSAGSSAGNSAGISAPNPTPNDNVSLMDS